MADGLNGDAVTQILKYSDIEDDDHHEHPIAMAMIPEFVPSVGQWILAMQGLGCTWNASTGTFSGNAKWAWAEVGLAEYALDENAEYWTCTEQKDGDTYKALAVKPTGNKFQIHTKTDKLRMRPFIAFGDWGTED